MIDFLLSLCHILLVIFTSIYSFVISKNFIYDFTYIIYMIFLLLSWILYDGNCIVSYYYKLFMQDDKNNDDKNMDDIDVVIDTNSILYKTIYVILTITTVFSIYFA